MRRGGGSRGNREARSLLNLLAELLLDAGREDEALPWYEGLRENTVAELVFSGPALLREAAIHRRAGRRGEAAQREGQFQNLWRNADPGLRDRVQVRCGG